MVSRVEYRTDHELSIQMTLQTIHLLHTYTQESGTVYKQDTEKDSSIFNMNHSADSTVRLLNRQNIYLTSEIIVIFYVDSYSRIKDCRYIFS